ncbi:DHHC palmitoyltransferase-domain-containing protein [Blastocladiella britannica]|nr:DHHC palmitoyltransferase-domain-containing protein [Blastocladiella britannica]
MVSQLAIAAVIGGGFGVVLFLMLLGPSARFKGTIIARAHHMLTTTIPSALLRLVVLVAGQRTVDRINSVLQWAGYERNPLVQLFYLFLVTGCGGLFLWSGWSKIEPAGLSILHKPSVLTSLALAYLSFFAASASDPGRITRTSRQLWTHDRILYFKSECRTCRFEKQARSKHCSLCGFCIARHDHHCIWINNCVGHANQPYFAAFLASVAWVSGYVCWLSASIVQLLLVKHGWVEVQSGSSWLHAQWFQYAYASNGQLTKFPIPFTSGLGNALVLEPALGSLALFLAFVAPLVALFLAHHLYSNVVRGVTTNESHKLEDVKYAIDDGDAWLAVDPQSGRTMLTDDERARPVAGAVPAPMPPFAYNFGLWRNAQEVLWPADLNVISPPASVAAAASTTTKKSSAKKRK